MKANELKNAVENIRLSDEAKEKIIEKMINNREKENNFMSKKKIGVLAVAAVMVIGVVAFAASGRIPTVFRGYSHGEAEYKTVPTEAELIKDIGYAPEVPAEFENGYTFYEASVMENALEDEQGVIEKFDSIIARYEKDSDEVLLSGQKSNTELAEVGELVATLDGIELYYDSYLNKGVAGNYKLTEEEKAREEAGEIVFSYGIETEEMVVHGLSFKLDGIDYKFTQLDGKLTKYDLIKMAEEIIKE